MENLLDGLGGGVKLEMISDRLEKSTIVIMIIIMASDEL